ncbi:MAG TPA: hypothetical protein VEQ63_16460 [Bryobacteraceae bacterium]|nr:hypothetical protein [Bryobacteraceae bacterium]
MKKFHFPLQSVLKWRELQETQEEARLAVLLASEARLMASANMLRAERTSTARTELAGSGLTGMDFRAAGAYLIGCAARIAQVEAELHQTRSQISKQRARCIDASRQVKLLDILREKQEAVWSREFDLHLEQSAAESYLARVARSSSGKAEQKS